MEDRHNCCFDNHEEKECCEKECMNCCINDCQDKCFRECNCDSGNGLGLLILLVVLYFIFCNNKDGRGGLLGGLF